MNKDKPKLKLISIKGTKGYIVSNIKEVLGLERFARFEKWIFGQTVMKYNGEDFIYRYDIERFLNGLPIRD